MRKSVKLLWAGFAIGFIGCAATVGVMVGTGTLMSREDSKTYAITTPFESVVFPSTEHTTTHIEVSKDGYSLEAYTKAWLPEPIDLDKIVSFNVEDGVLYITDTPFPDGYFFGFFPQPYELKLTLYVPEEYFEQHITGGAK